MADTKLADFTEIDSVAGGDLFYMVDDPAGTPLNKKGTFTKLAAYLDDLTQTLTNKTISTASNTITVAEADISDLGTTVAMVADNLSVFAATTSAQLAGVISDETGSGSLVFATSPTLVTPALGTPSSGALGSCTAYEGTAVASTGEAGGSKFLREDGDGTCSWQDAGDALVANPLSQFAATTSAQLAGVISDETGTGAFVCATSPTLVTPVLGTPSSGALGSCTAYESTSLASTGEAGGTKFLREDGDGTCSWQAVPGGGDALTSNPLSQFAATTSAQLAGVISDETGSGALAFATSPTFVTPALGTPASGALGSCTAYEGTAVASTGEAAGTKFLREDGDGTCSWQTPAGSGDVSKVGTPVDNQIGVWTGDGTIEGTADFTFDGADLLFYNAVNDGNPEIRIGATDAEELHIQAVYDSAAQTLDKVVFTTDVASATTDKGKFEFMVDGATALTVVDSGIQMSTNGLIRFGSSDVLTASIGLVTLKNIVAIDATTEATIETAIDTLANLTAAAALVTVGTLTTGNADAIVSASSTTTAGKIEVATSAETNTGTDAARCVSPDGLAGSYAGTKSVQAVIFEFGASVQTGDGKFYLHVSSAIAGMNLVAVHAEVITAGTTGTSDIQIANVTQAADMLSTVITIDSAETGSDTAATPAVIDTGNDDVAENDLLRIDVDAVSTTAPLGLIVTLEFRLP